MAEKRPRKPLGELLAGSYDSGAQGAKIGDLFSYEPKEKVSISRGQAAMVPIVSKPISGRRLLYYKASFAPRSYQCFCGAKCYRPDAGGGRGHLLRGEHVARRGHSQPHTPARQPGSHPLRLGCLSGRHPAGKKPSGATLQGLASLTAYLPSLSVETLTNTWKIVNRGRESATLWLHQPRNAGYRLSKPEKPLKEVDNHYRFEVPLKAGETVDFVVEEKRDVRETVHLDKSSEEQIRFYLAQPYLSAGRQGLYEGVERPHGAEGRLAAADHRVDRTGATSDRGTGPTALQSPDAGVTPAEGTGVAGKVGCSVGRE